MIVEKKNIVFDLIYHSTECLLNYNVENPKLESELIICNILQCDRIDLYAKYYNKKLNNIQSTKCYNYLRRRMMGEPIQYILESAPFYGRNFFVNKNVLIPRFDSELMIDILKKYSCVDNLLEIGTGSGNLAITIAMENIAKNIIATDISKTKLDIAKYNKKRLSPDSKIKFIIDDFINSTINKKFNIIISNPPYIPENEIHNLDNLVKNNEPLNSLTDGKDGYSFYRKLALKGKHILTTNGFMLLEIGVDNKLGKLKNIFREYKINYFNDFNKIPRLIKVY